MRIKNLYLLVIILFSISNISIYQSINVTGGIQITFKTFHFYIHQPATISFDVMYFQLGNTNDLDRIAICDYEKIPGVNYSVDLSWNNTLLKASEIKSNYYNITITESFSTTLMITIECKFKAIESDNSTLTEAISFFNYVTFYSENDGHLLELRIVDQVNRLRNSTIKINYKFNDSDSYTPLKQLINQSSYKSYFPVGYYQILAQDLETNEIGESYFYLDQDMTINLKIELVAFSQFKIIFTETCETIKEYLWSKEKEICNVDRLGIDFTILNKLDKLTNLEIYAELYRDNKYVTMTNPEKRTELEKTSNYGLTLWFNLFEWKQGSYQLKAYIISNGIIIATKTKQFTPILNENREDRYYQYFQPTGYFITGIISVILIKELINKINKSRRG